MNYQVDRFFSLPFYLETSVYPNTEVNKPAKRLLVKCRCGIVLDSLIQRYTRPNRLSENMQ